MHAALQRSIQIHTVCSAFCARLLSFVVLWFDWTSVLRMLIFSLTAPIFSYLCLWGIRSKYWSTREQKQHHLYESQSMCVLLQDLSQWNHQWAGWNQGVGKLKHLELEQTEHIELEWGKWMSVWYDHLLSFQKFDVLCSFGNILYSPVTNLQKNVWKWKNNSPVKSRTRIMWWNINRAVHKQMPTNLKNDYFQLLLLNVCLQSIEF